MVIIYVRPRKPQNTLPLSIESPRHGKQLPPSVLVGCLRPHSNNHAWALSGHRSTASGFQHARELPLSYLLSTGAGLSKLVSPSGRRTLRSIAAKGMKKFKSNQVIFVRSDSTSANSSSSCSSSSASSPNQTPWPGGGDAGCGSSGRGSRGSNGSNGGESCGTGDASHGHIGAGHDRRNLSHDSTLKAGSTEVAEQGKESPPPSLAALDTAASASEASCRRHCNSGGGSGSGRRKNGRIACSGGEVDDNGLRIEHGGRDGGKGGVRNADDGSKNRRGSPNGGNLTEMAIDARRRIQPTLAFRLLLRIAVRSTQWARKRYRSSAKAQGVRFGAHC